MENDIADPEPVKDLGPPCDILRAHAGLLPSHIDHAAPPGDSLEIRTSAAPLI
jgi:hypothetical protein